MGPVSNNSSPLPFTTVQNRADISQQQSKDQAVKERLDLTKPSGTSLARTQKSETRDYQASEELIVQAQANNNTQQTRGGGKRGSVLDISV